MVANAAQNGTTWPLHAETDADTTNTVPKGMLAVAAAATAAAAAAAVRLYGGFSVVSRTIAAASAPMMAARASATYPAAYVEPHVTPAASAPTPMRGRRLGGGGRLSGGAVRRSVLAPAPAPASAPALQTSPAPADMNDGTDVATEPDCAPVAAEGAGLVQAVAAAAAAALADIRTADPESGSPTGPPLAWAAQSHSRLVDDDDDDEDENDFVAPAYASNKHRRVL
jgi:hypothetical protein